MGLIKEWIKINFGPEFTEVHFNASILVSNTRPSRPIITIMDNPAEDPIVRLKDVHKQAQIKAEEATTTIISIKWSNDPDFGSEFDSIIKGAIVQSQWVVI